MLTQDEKKRKALEYIEGFKKQSECSRDDPYNEFFHKKAKEDIEIWETIIEYLTYGEIR